MRSRRVTRGAIPGGGAGPSRHIGLAEACVKVEKFPPGGARKSYKLGKSLPFCPLARLRAERVGVRGQGARKLANTGVFLPRSTNYISASAVFLGPEPAILEG